MRYKIPSTPHRKLTTLAFISVVILLIANLMVSNIIATSGEQLRQLQERNKNLENQNSKLRQEIIQTSALNTLENKAYELGFAKSTETLTLSSQPPVALSKK
jgi:cell division protein FtsB